ncbi:unnamed protein product, partial [marine sediment metagenome]
YNRVPDAIVVEGPLSGGHIAGYKLEELEAIRPRMWQEPILENALKDVMGLAAEYGKEFKTDIPVIAAGGIFDGKDIAKFLRLGAKGVQIGTRFVATHECPVSDKYKQLYVNSTEDDLVFIQSPVGLPAKAIRTKFIDRILNGERADFNCVYQCLRTCDPSKVSFCIAKSLINAIEGDVDDAIVFAGSCISRITKIVSVKELIDELVSETIKELGGNGQTTNISSSSVGLSNKP